MAEPTTMILPTLGNLPALGELYDGNTNTLLGVQLYTQKGIKDATISTPRDPPYTELNISTSQSFQEKAAVIDIKGSLSLELLGGLISVSGSASYLKDNKSNTTQESFAMTLKMEGKEERIEIGNPSLIPLGENLIGPYERATHYVSAIQYGGNAVITMVAIQSELTDDEKIAGSLQASLKKLLKYVDLSGSADMKIYDQYSYMDGKFDLHMYGDFTIAKVPANANDTLLALPEIYQSLKDAGVPIKYTLQPIPPDLRSKVSFIYSLDDGRIFHLLETFAKLDDLNNRFIVLSNDVDRYKDVVPYLARAVISATKDFTSGTDEFPVGRVLLMDDLRKVLDITATGGSADEEIESLLTNANKLIRKHRQNPRDDKILPPKYPVSLSGLEKAFDKFSSLNTALKYQGVSLTSLPSLARSLAGKKEAMLFLTWAVSATTITEFTLLIAKGFGEVYGSYMSCYFVYLETIADLKDTRIPKGSTIDATDPSKSGLFRYDVQAQNITWTKLTWDDIKNDHSSQVNTTAYKCPLGDYLYARDCNTAGASVCSIWTYKDYNPAGDFSLFVKAKVYSLDTDRLCLFNIGKSGWTGAVICTVSEDREGPNMQVQIYTEKTKDFLFLKTPAGRTQVKLRKPHEYFTTMFVQDAQNKKWTLYVDGYPEASLEIPAGFALLGLDSGTGVRVGLSEVTAVNWKNISEHWNGMFESIEAHPKAINPDEMVVRFAVQPQADNEELQTS